MNVSIKALLPSGIAFSIPREFAFILWMHSYEYIAGMFKLVLCVEWKTFKVCLRILKSMLS